MKTLFFIIAAILLLAIVKQPAKRKSSKRFKYNPDGEWPFIKKNLMTPTEEGFYKVLKEALPEYTVFVQVGLSRLIDVKKGNDYQQWFNRVSRMSVDYVLVDEKLRTVAAIELDDASHNTKQAKERDARKNKALAAAKIRLIRWHVKKMPDANEIRKALGFDVSKSVENTMEHSVK